MRNHVVLILNAGGIRARTSIHAYAARLEVRARGLMVHHACEGASWVGDGDNRSEAGGMPARTQVSARQTPSPPWAAMLKQWRALLVFVGSGSATTPRFHRPLRRPHAALCNHGGPRAESDDPAHRTRPARLQPPAAFAAAMPLSLMQLAARAVPLRVRRI